MKIDRLILPASILIASLIIGGFLYAIQANKQKSIEKQQEIELQENRRLEEAKKEQEEKEYIAKRKSECYSLYEKERDKWNNVKGSRYSELRDVCVIRYQSDKPAKSEKECEEMLDNIDPIELSREGKEVFWEDYENCFDNWFTKEF